jgi:hypothetical protein
MQSFTTNINLAKLYNVIDNKVAKAEPKIPNNGIKSYLIPVKKPILHREIRPHDNT